jgi:four helix bundle protein
MKNDLETRTKRFAFSIIELVGKLPHCKASDVIGYQLLKSGTSIGANYREAARAQSRDDFIHKIGICAKDTSETEYWLELAQGADLIADRSKLTSKTTLNCLNKRILLSDTSRKSKASLCA